MRKGIVKWPIVGGLLAAIAAAAGLLPLEVVQLVEPLLAALGL